MNAALRNHLAIEMRELFEQPNILQRNRATRTSRNRVLVIGDGRACGSSELPVGHDEIPFVRCRGRKGGANSSRECAIGKQRKNDGTPISAAHR